jgi:hypothetical protein
MRSFASSLVVLMTLAALLFSAGASTPVGSATDESVVFAERQIPEDADPFPSLAESGQIDPTHDDDVRLELTREEPRRKGWTESCQIPLRGATCTEGEFRAAEIEIDPYVLVPSTVDSVDDWRPLVTVFFAEEDVDRAIDIIGCESRGDPSAKNPTSSATGLFQHLGSEWDRRAYGSGWGGADIFDPVANTAVAAWLVYEAGGWSHWAASGHCW